MAFRTVIVDTHSKLEYSLNYLIFRTSDDIKRVLLDEVHTIIVKSTAVSLTSSLLSELVKRKIKVIFCDEKSNPISELSPLYGSHNVSGRLFEQINWPNEYKDEIWKRIIEEKIINQANSLYRKGKIDEYHQLIEYSNNVQPGDITNREGHSAKVYFNSRYFKGFTRDEDCPLNAYLNYGYSLILSQFNRCIVACGYLTQIGIHHKNEFNQYNLSCDLMEPFRFVIDDFVEDIKEESNWKEELIGILSKDVEIDGKFQSLANAINIYCLSVFNAINNGNVAKIKFIKNEL